jgi:hypothetical protein
MEVEGRLFIWEGEGDKWEGDERSKGVSMLKI